MSIIILFNKPYGVLSQFRAKDDQLTLADYLQQPDIHPAGRLDKDSEGLLVLTNDGRLQHRIAHPKHKAAKVYWVQVEGIPDAKALARLSRGVRLKDGLTRPAKVKLMAEPPIWPRHPPIRYRASIPTRWLELTLSEGRNRQVRRMTAAVGHPTLRLIRYQIGDWTLDGLQPGEWKVIQSAATMAPQPDKPRRKKPHAGKPPRHRRRHH